MPSRKTLPYITPKFSPYLPRWKDLKARERRFEIVSCAMQHAGYAVTVNLPPDVARSLAAHPNPMRKIAQRFNEKLVRHDLRGLKLLLSIEATRDTARPHLHGVVVTDELPKPVIEHLFREAVGRINGRSGSRQFKAVKLYDAKGWDSYMHKDCRFTRRILALSNDNQLFWVTHAMTRFAQKDYEAKREAASKAANFSSAPTTKLGT